jgi:hypothetical protein
MIICPRLKTFLSVFPLGDAMWGLRGGTDELWRIKLTDARAVRAFGALLPYLDGRTPVEEILRLVENDGIHRGAALAVLRQLEMASLVEDADAHGLSDADLTRFSEQIRWLSRFTQEGGAKLQAQLLATRIALLGTGPLSARLLDALVGSGFGEPVVLARATDRSPSAHPGATSSASRPTTFSVDTDSGEIWPAEAGELPPLLIVGQDVHDPRLLEAVDQFSKRRRVPWMLVRHLELQEGWVGPIFVPGETASYLSLEARFRANVAGFTEYAAFDAQLRGPVAAAPMGGLRAMFDLLAAIAAIEAIKFITEIRVSELLGRFLTINPWTWETEMHDVLRMPALDRLEASRPPVFPWRVAGDDQHLSASGGV